MLLVLELLNQQQVPGSLQQKGESQDLLLQQHWHKVVPVGLAVLLVADEHAPLQVLQQYWLVVPAAFVHALGNSFSISILFSN